MADISIGSAPSYFGMLTLSSRKILSTLGLCGAIIKKDDLHSMKTDGVRFGSGPLQTSSKAPVSTIFGVTYLAMHRDCLGRVLQNRST